MAAAEGNGTGRRRPAEIVVRVFSARNLETKKGEKEVAAYVQMELGRQKFRTASCEKSAKPTWGEEASLESKDGKATAVVLTVLTEKGDHFLGQVTVPLDDVPEKPLGKRFWPLKGKPKHEKDGEHGDRKWGELCFELWTSKYEWESKDAPELGRRQISKRLSMPGRDRTRSNTSQSTLESLKEDEDSQSRGKGSEHGTVESPSPGADVGNPFAPVASSTSPPTLAAANSGSFSSETSSAGGVHTAVPGGARRPPEITSVAPKQGPEEGGTRVTVRGADLGEGKADILALTVCGIDCLRSLEHHGSKEIVFTTPPGHGHGRGEVFVRTGAGETSSFMKFTYVAAVGPGDDGIASEDGAEKASGRGGAMGRRASLMRNSVREKLGRRSANERPEITGISPDAGSLSGGTKVNIQGRNLGSSAADIASVTVAGVECAPSQVAWISSALIQIKTAVGSGKGPVTVSLKGGLSCTSPSEFSYVSGESNNDARSGAGAHENGSPADGGEGPAASSLPLTTDERSRLLAQVEALKKRVKALEDENRDLRRYIDEKLVAVLSGDLSLLVR